MRNSEIAIMLTFVNTLDGRINPDDATVISWGNVLTKDMNATWAAEFVKKHYGKTGDMLIPSMLNKAWYEHKSIHQSAQIDRTTLEAHCGKSGCTCNHTACYKGWIDTETTTSPCGMCREELYTLIMTMPPPGLRNSADQAVLQGRGKN